MDGQTNKTHIIYIYSLRWVHVDDGTFAEERNIQIYTYRQTDMQTHTKT